VVRVDVVLVWDVVEVKEVVLVVVVEVVVEELWAAIGFVS